MDERLKEKIKQFVLQEVNETKVSAVSDSFWQGLKNTGTELWLDTGDMEEAEKNWSAEMTALTTNNTLVNKEIQKGIYDEFIEQAVEIVKDLPIEEQIVEIAFILNARHGIRLAKKFSGFVSVELHTNTAYDFDSIVDYALRYFSICPDQFIIKVPYTATGLLGARKLRELGVKISFTLEFSARQNAMVAAITKPNYCNVFLGRIGAYIKDNELGSGSGAGERTVISAQHIVSELTKNNETPTQLIAASLRHYSQLDALAGTDVFTMPTKVAADGKINMDGNFQSKLNEVYPVDLTDEAANYFPEKLWEVSEKELQLAKSLDAQLPKNENELIDRVHEAGCGDMFPYLSEKDYKLIYDDGKIPNHQRWAQRIASGELAIDTLLNLAGLASFTADQAALDDRIRKIIGG
ncbi:transaldolase [Draconibacterium orientale]|uniref:Transaldolase n=1 Tax=Draconibacterium orientale TaxID=1168034 RepID=X5D783_9BACT|nr:transaldolase family protein [Draconibacterium orientale]AHW58513.1 transaldolase [Draconibacterium orientale]SET88163.1 transaldolase [Draconibacterium orientale]